MRHSVDITITLHRYPEVRPEGPGRYLTYADSLWMIESYLDDRWPGHTRIEFWAELPAFEDDNVKQV